VNNNRLSNVINRLSTYFVKEVWTSHNDAMKQKRSTDEVVSTREKLQSSVVVYNVLHNGLAVARLTRKRFPMWKSVPHGW